MLLIYQIYKWIAYQFCISALNCCQKLTEVLMSQKISVSITLGARGHFSYSELLYISLQISSEYILMQYFSYLTEFFLVICHLSKIPNQELSGAKPELKGETVSACSFYKRSGQLPYNLPITHLLVTPRSLQVCLLAHFNKWSIYE